MTGFTESIIMKGNLFLLFAFAAGFCCIAGSLCADEGIADNDLVTPEMTSQEPAAGRRVRQVAHWSSQVPRLGLSRWKGE